MHFSFLLALSWCGDICSPSPQGAALGWTQPGFNPVSPTTGAGSVSSLVRISLLGKAAEPSGNPHLFSSGFAIHFWVKI
jgi:hypothetical protein